MIVSLVYLAKLILQLSIKIIVVMKVERRSLAIEQLLDGQSQLWISMCNCSDYLWIVVLLGGVIPIFSLCYSVKCKREAKKKSLLILKLETTNKALEQKIHFKRMLLKENHHRVKNNFQMIMSLISIDFRLDKSRSIDFHIEKIETRIGVLALLYDSFSDIEQGNVVSLPLYVEKLIAYNQQMIGTDQVSITVTVVAIIMDIQIAVCLGLIINELLWNSLKHAFPKGAKGKIVIRIKQRKKGDYAFHYSDDGVKEVTKKQSKNSSGLKLLSGLVEQIKGYSTKVDFSHGLAYEFNFKNWA